MPNSTCVEIPPAEHGQRLAVRRRARDGYVLTLHLLWWWADGRRPTELAEVLFCARSSGYRAGRA